MKKFLCALLTLCITLSLCACTGKADVAPAVTAAPKPVKSAEPTASDTPAVVFPSGAEQITLIANSLSTWECKLDYESDYDYYRYAVTDLDANGRLEIFAAITQGTGIYTSGRFFEVSESGDTLIEYPLSANEYSFLPEVTVSKTVKYTDSAKGETHYIFNDNTRNGAAEFYNTVFAMTLKNGTVSFTPLGSYESISRDGNTPDEVWYDAAGERITKEQYDALADSFFAGCSASEARFGWFGLKDGELSELLNTSYKVFTGELSAMPTTAASAAPATTPAPAPAPTPAPQIPVGQSGNIRITKNPTSESLSIGGKTWFIAHAENASGITWQFIDPNGRVLSVEETMSENAGLSLQVLDGDTIAVDKVPQSLNGWGVQAVFSDGNNAAATSPAYIYVGDFVGAYSEVIQKYKNAYAAGSIDYGRAMEYGISEMAGYSTSAGYALKDLDKDGIPEMIVAGVGSSLDGDPMIFEIDTLKNGEVATLCTSSARDRYYLRTDSMVLNIGSGGAAYTTYYLLSFKDGNLSPIIELSSDLDDNAAAFWHYKEYGGAAGEKKLGYEEGLALAESYESVIYLPPLTKIS